MTFRLLAAALVALVLAAAAQAQPAVAVPPIAFSSRTLANGLKIYSAVDRATPDVTVQVWYGVGAKDDPKGRSGFAHLFEHLMFKGARDMPPEFIDRLTEDVGGTNNASTDDDFTNFYEVIPANHLERLLWAEAERMSSLVVDQANFKSERQVVEEELRQTVLADPYGRLFNLAIPAASFTVHPYKRAPIGSIADLESATLDDVRAFHATYYRPDDASLIVIGNFDQGQLDQWVDRYFGPIKQPAAAIPRVTAVEPARTGPGTYDATGPNVPLPALAITWLGPAKRASDAPALEVAEAILGTGESSRLYRDLVHDQQLAAQVQADADLRQQPGLFVVSAVMAGGKTLQQGEMALRAEVARLRDAPADAAELDRAKTQLTAQALRERETVDGKGFALGYAIALEGDAGRANDAIARLQAVTADDVQRVARLYLSDDRRMVIRYRQAPEAAADQAGADSGGAAPAAQPAAESPHEPPPPVGPPVQAVLPTPVERTLPNGLRVIVAKSTDLPLATAELLVRAGSGADPDDRAGLAEMSASLLKQGAGGRTAAEVARDVEALGGTLDAGAGWDSSQVTLDAMADRLDPALAILADVVRRPTLSAGELDRLRQQSLDDLSVQLQDPGALAGFVTPVVLFAGAPYGHVASGTPASLKRITPADVAAFHAAYYRPDNAILVLTGDIDPGRGFALAARLFGDWQAPATPLPLVRKPGPIPTPRVIVVDLPGTGQAAVTLALPGIRRADPQFYPGLVANAVLGGGYSARLNEEIRIKRGLSYDAESALEARRAPGPFEVLVQTKNESAPQVVDLILAEIGKLRASPADPAELAARAANLTGEYGRKLETTNGLAAVLGTYALQDIPLTEIARYDDQVRAVSPAAAENFAAAMLDPAEADVIVVGDAKLFIDGLRARFPNVEVIPSDQLDLDGPRLRKTGG